MYLVHVFPRAMIVMIPLVIIMWWLCSIILHNSLSFDQYNDNKYYIIDAVVIESNNLHPDEQDEETFT